MRVAAMGLVGVRDPGSMREFSMLQYVYIGRRDVGPHTAAEVAEACAGAWSLRELKNESVGALCSFVVHLAVLQKDRSEVEG
jgi:hypothetical protein